MNTPQTASSRLSGRDEDGFDIDDLIEPALLAAIATLDGRAPLLAGMVRYHLGYAGSDLAPIERSLSGPR